MLGKTTRPVWMVLCVSVAASASAADRPGQSYWAGRNGEKPKPKFINAGSVQPQTGDAADAPKQPAADQAAATNTPRVPEWYRRMDPNDRATLRGGWRLQNLSGGTQPFTTAGDRAGQYAPNLYQGAQFQQWNNVATRQEIPSWNGSAMMFPREMWSQGYVSPNNYYGPDAQAWGNMSSGRIEPNYVSGGWTWR